MEDVRSVSDRAVVRWLVARGKADAVRRRLSSRKEAQLRASFEMLADVQGVTRVEGQQAVVDPLELSRTMELLGLRDDSQPSRPATAEPDAGMGFDAFVQTIMQRQDSLCEQERRWGGPEPIPVLELFPMMARAYDVRRAVDRSGAGEPQAGAKAAARTHAPRKARQEQPGVGRRRPSATPTLPPPPPGARGGAQLSPGPGAASEARSMPKLRGELPTGGGEGAPLSASSARSAVSACTATGTEVGRRGGIFWGVFNSYGETYASYKQLRAEYEARWLDGSGGGALDGGSPSRAGGAAASAAAAGASADGESAEDELASVFLGTTKREAEEDLIVLAEPAPADNLGRRRIVGGPLPRSLALLGTPAAAAAAAVAGGQGRAGGGTAREAEGQLLRAASSGPFPSSPPGGGATQHGRRPAPAAARGSSRSRNGLPHSATLGSAAEQEARFGESREPQLPMHHAKHVARSRVLPSLELPQAGMGRRKPAGAMEARPRLRHVQPARNTEHALGKEAMQARMQAWHDMRMSTLENGPLREETIRMGRSLRQRERIYLAHTNPLPVADDGVHEFFS